MMRIPIGGCDFDLAPWAYNEEPTNDAALSNFTALDARDLERVDIDVLYLDLFELFNLWGHRLRFLRKSQT